MRSASPSRTRAARSSAPRSSVPLLALLAASCTGVFQGTLPETPQSWSASAPEGQLEIGAAEADITPPGVQYLAGYRIARESVGVFSRLAVRAFVVRRGELEVALVGIDNLGLQREDVEWIKSGIAGFHNGAVFLCASHTHAAPDLVGFWGRYFLSSGRDRDYLALVRSQTVAAVAEARAKARPARLVRGEALLPPRGLVRNSKREEVFDRRMTVLQARDLATDAPFAALLHLSCHPEVLRRVNEKLSSDYVGALCERWQAAGLGQPVFVNGAIGAMVTPGITPNGEPGVPLMGERLFELGKQALASARDVAGGGLEVRRRDLFSPFTSPALLLGRLSLAIPRAVYQGYVRSTVGYLRIGDLEIATVPGEMEPGLAARIRRESGRPGLLVLGLVDDELGYLMGERDARNPRFEYERLMSTSVDIGERVLAALLR